MLIRTDTWPQKETFIFSILIVCENKQGNPYCCTSCVTLFETVWTPCDCLIQVKTIEKVLLGLRKWWPRPLNSGQNYSTSGEVIFGTLKTDRLIEGDCLIWCRLIQVRLYVQSIRITVCYFIGSWKTSSKRPTSLACLVVFSLEMERDTYLLLR